MKILHIITDLNVGGAEMMLLNLVVEHHKYGFEILVIGLANDGPIGEKLRQFGIPVVTLGMKTNHQDQFPFLRLVNLIKSIKPDIIQTWMYHADLFGSLAALIAGNPRVIWGLHHTLNKSIEIKPFTNIIIRINSLLSNFIPKKVICCSVETMRSHIKIGYSVRKLVVIPNGTDLVRFQMDRDAGLMIKNEFGLSPENHLIGMIARFHPQKDHHTFIQAAKILNKVSPKVHYILAGAQMDYANKEIVNWINEVGLENHIHLTGLRNDIPQLISSLDIATLSSAFGEALPVSICEAMACGIPCVVTDVGDSKKIVANAGICVPTRNPNALADGWNQILSLNPAERSNLGKLARAKIEKEYNITFTARRYSEVYELVS